MGWLPWTNAQYQQILGRLIRKGQISDVVHVYIVKAKVSGYPYAELKWNRIQFKRTLAECAKDNESSNSNEHNKMTKMIMTITILTMRATTSAMIVNPRMTSVIIVKAVENSSGSLFSKNVYKLSTKTVESWKPGPNFLERPFFWTNMSF